MAEKLARMYGTEEDKVNCPFYFKIGACRYGDKCLRIHNKPPYSQTILIKSMYPNLPVELALASGNQVSEEQAKEALQHFEDFYEEVFSELANYGELEEVIVCDNIGDHLLGAVYVKYVYEDDAIKCMEAIRNRYYDGKILQPEYSPVTDFSNAKCKQFIEGSCKRGGYCNYMHLKPISANFKRDLFRQMYDDHPEYKKSRRSKSRKSKKKKHKKHRSSRSRSGSRKKKSKKKKSRSPSIRTDMNSEERRAIIAQWQIDDEQDQTLNPPQDEPTNVPGITHAQLTGLDLNQLQKNQQLLDEQSQQFQQQQQQAGIPALQINYP